MEDIIISLNNASVFSNIFWAALVFFIGLILSKKSGSIIENLLQNIKLNQATKNLGWHNFFEKYNTKLNASRFFGMIVQLYVILITFMVSSEILNLSVLSEFFLNVIQYYPNILISSVIFVMAVFVADFSKKIVYAGADLKYSNTLSAFIGASTWVLAALAIFYQLKIVPDLIITLFVGVVVALALTFGLSFGLGGQELVKDFLKKIQKKIK
ncbi:MAG TPA: hypothetical protein PKU93_02770 [Candidatus Pacearchaeota archaeon]|nr:hypothetical protein [Candidatus Pacearchaeota archaeon]